MHPHEPILRSPPGKRQKTLCQDLIYVPSCTSHNEKARPSKMERLREKETAHQFGVYFCVQPGIADEVDDPSLGLVGGHVQLVRQHAET